MTYRQRPVLKKTKFAPILKHILFLFVWNLWPTCIHAYNYGEHKQIGDQAFAAFVDRLLAQKTLGNSTQTMAWLERYAVMHWDSVAHLYTFTPFATASTIPVSYGVLNGLAGDHSPNPLALEESLLYANSTLWQVLIAHNQALAQQQTGAADKRLLQLDKAYLSLALNNFSHFYYYGRSLRQHLNVFAPELIQQGLIPNQVSKVFTGLSHTNAINMYVTVHAMAIELAQLAGTSFKTDPQRTKQYLFYSLLYNGFADHFLEDSFAAGHMVVNRTFWAGFTNNRSLHNLYNRNGVEVANLTGETWRAYGDGSFNQTHGDWNRQSNLAAISNKPFTAEAQRTINAVSMSIQEVWDAFLNAQKGQLDSFSDLSGSNTQRVTSFFTQRFNVLTLIPIPFNTPIDYYTPKAANLTILKERTQLLPYRNFDKSRIGNSLSLGFSNGLVTQSVVYSATEVRLNTAPLSYAYRFRNPDNTTLKASYFLRPTVAAAFGRRLETNLDERSRVTTFQAGLSGNLDYWISPKRYLGVYSYVQAGVYRETGERYKPLFAPSVGVQLGSLLGIRYYDMPAWLRWTTQLIFPLKFRANAYFVNGRQPLYFFTTELDVFY